MIYSYTSYCKCCTFVMGEIVSSIHKEMTQYMDRTKVISTTQYIYYYTLKHEIIHNPINWYYKLSYSYSKRLIFILKLNKSWPRLTNNCNLHNNY